MFNPKGIGIGVGAGLGSGGVPAFAENSLQTDGSGDYAGVPYNASYYQETVNISTGVWMKINSPNGINSAMFAQGGTSVSFLRWYIQEELGYLRVTCSSSGTSLEKIYIDTSTDLDDGAWHLVGFTFAANDLKLYIDGAETTSLTKSSDATCNTLATSTNHSVWLNTLGLSVALRPFNGWTHGFFYHDKVLSTSEWAEAYNSGVAIDMRDHSASANLTGYWPVNGDSASGPINEVINNQDATVTGTPTISTDVPN